MNGLIGEIQATGINQDIVNYVKEFTGDEKNEILDNPRWRVHSASEALEPRPPIEYIVNGLIAKKDLTVFYGHPGSKKTYALLHMGACVGGGASWLGMETNKTNVLIIDEESGEDRIARRLKEIILGESLTVSDLCMEYVCHAGFMLDNVKDSVLLEALINETEAGLVIIDALADIMSGDENSKQDTQPVFIALRKIANRTGAAIVIIHHSGKNGDYRGSSAIKGAVEGMIQVKSSDDGNRIDFDVQKNRDGKEFKFSAIASWVNNQFYLTRTDETEKLSLGKAQSYVMRYLEERGNSTIQDIMSNADVCAPNGARSAVYSLADMGMIKRVNPGASAMTAAIYGIVERGNI